MKLLYPAVSILLFRNILSLLDFEGKRFDCGSKLGYLKATIEYALEHKELSKEFRNYLKKLKM